MSNTTLTNDEKRCLQMWMRQAIAHVEQQEALRNITAFYNGSDSKSRDTHQAPSFKHTAGRGRVARAKELV